LNGSIRILALSFSGKNSQNSPRGADFSKPYGTIRQTIGPEN
jgi:hypothetical protein